MTPLEEARERIMEIEVRLSRLYADRVGVENAFSRKVADIDAETLALNGKLDKAEEELKKALVQAVEDRANLNPSLRACAD